MNRIERLIHDFDSFVALPWPRNLAGPQRVWFAVYDENDERKVRARIDEFAIATKRAGHRWQYLDLTDAFPEWLASQDYRDEYFTNPADLKAAVRSLRAEVTARLRATLEAADEQTVVAVGGIAALFGFLKVSELIHDVESSIKGRLLVFFPGEHEGNNFRLLDARDGWNYLAVPITGKEKPAP